MFVCRAREFGAFPGLGMCTTDTKMIKFQNLSCPASLTRRLSALPWRGGGCRQNTVPRGVVLLGRSLYLGVDL